MRVNRILQAIGGLTLGAALLVAATPVANIIAKRVRVAEDLTPADAIVVLGAGIQEDGRLGNASLQRAVRGIEIHNMGLAPLILMLGPERIEGMPSEAAARAQLAENLGVESGAVLTESDGLTTRYEVAVSRERLSPLGVESILLVTETQHLIRAIPLFENAGFEVRPVSADDYSLEPENPVGRFELMSRIFWEQLARIYYRAAGYL
jgi:uncharacterized SAM-binding protein YcdF (DUF218 family)